MRHLIDTDWVVDYLKGREPAVSLLHRLRPEGIAISVITFGEVYEGIQYGHHPERDAAALQEILRVVIVLDVNLDVAREFALIRGALRRVGLLIPQPDLLIAATAIHYDLTLVTRNLRHYERIPEIRLFPVQHQT